MGQAGAGVAAQKAVLVSFSSRVLFASRLCLLMGFSPSMAREVFGPGLSRTVILIPWSVIKAALVADND
jgi:hypothetical protein